jgi:hypothetical protein
MVIGQDESNSHLGLAKLKRLHIFNLDNNPDLRTLPLEMFALGSSLYVHHQTARPAPGCDRVFGWHSPNSHYFWTTAVD